jgi:hypothetical protein
MKGLDKVGQGPTSGCCAIEEEKEEEEEEEEEVCPIPNGFRDRAISHYNFKIVDKKEILRTVSHSGIYCSSDKVGTVYLVIPPSTTMHFETRVRTWRVARLYSAQYSVQYSELYRRNGGHIEHFIHRG